jgi:hypothetical protein
MAKAINEYTASTLVEYECRDSVGGWSGLVQLNHVDKEFEERLKKNKSLKHCYDKIMNAKVFVMDRDENEEEVMLLAKEFIEFGVMNRARFACEQKLELARCRHHFRDDSAKSQALAMVNSELEHSYVLLSKFDSPEICELKNTMQICLESDLDDYQESDSESLYEMPAEDHPEEEEARDEVHVIPHFK